MFAPNDDQQLLMESVARFNAKNYPDDKLEQMGEQPFAEAVWNEMAEAGWFMLPFSEEDGGLQADGASGLGDCISLFEMLGQGLVVEPVLASAIMAGSMVAGAKNHDGREAMLEGIISGAAPMGVALHEPRARNDFGYCATTAEKSGDGWTLNGKKSLAFGGGAAKSFLVLARIDGKAGDGLAGVGIFIVNEGDAGVNISRYALRDDHWVANLTLDGAKLSGDALLYGAGDAEKAVDAMLLKAKLMMAAESVGIMKRLVAATGAYTAERKQFGKPLAVFQVLQHKMVDMAVAHDQTRSLVYEAVTRNSNGDADGFAKAVEAAYRSASEDGLAVAKEAIQIHGGMGMSEELPIGRCMRRILAIKQILA